MTNRDNLLSLLRRQGYGQVPVDLMLCPSLEDQFHQRTGSRDDYFDYFGVPWRYVRHEDYMVTSNERFLQYHDVAGMNPGTTIDAWGVAHEPGSESAKHMTRMHHPLQNADSMTELESYPWPAFREGYESRIREKIQEIQNRDLVVHGSIGSPVWEYSWFIRGMEPLMMDMMSEDPMAEYILDKVTAVSRQAAVTFASSGADILHMGDDVGMQHSLMMSEEMFSTWILPRIAEVIHAAKSIKPDMLVFFHSCGYIRPFIPLLIDAGVDILNPVQPECMDFADIHADFGDRVSFHGTIGTQTTMPFGTPDDVRREVLRNLTIAGPKGGLFVAPTHLLEPEVPWENIEAYIGACREFLQ